MAAVAELLDDRVIALEEIGGGRNSKLYKATCSRCGPYAVKCYYRDGSRDQSRLQREFTGLQFLTDNGVRSVPRPIVTDAVAGCAVYEYIEGTRPAPADIDPVLMAQVVEFTAALRGLAAQAARAELPLASEACFSLAAVGANIDLRLDRLYGVSESGEAHDDLRRFLDGEFKPLLRELAVGETALDRDALLAAEDRIPSPSDFGFHNALRRPDGMLVFLDFEHFGWDDPAKLISDFLLHPHESMAIHDDLKRHFVAGVLPHFGDRTDALAARLEAVYPLFALKWCMILLNEFVPEYWSRRRFSGASGLDRDAVLSGQLAKARQMLTKARSGSDHFPFWS